MAKSNNSTSIFGWYPDWLIDWYVSSSSDPVDNVPESVESLNGIYSILNDTRPRNWLLSQVTGSWNNTQKEELYDIYVSASQLPSLVTGITSNPNLASEFSSSLGL